MKRGISTQFKIDYFILILDYFGENRLFGYFKAKFPIFLNIYEYISLILPFFLKIDIQAERKKSLLPSHCAKFGHSIYTQDRTL